MPLTYWHSLTTTEQNLVKELALLDGVDLSDENCSELLKGCRDKAVGAATREDNKEAKRDLWGNKKAPKSKKKGPKSG